MPPLPYTLRQLEYTVAVSDTGGFRKAAASCAVSQPALSAQVAALERALGVPLFERTSRRVLPTAAGDELLDRARRLLADGADLLDAGRRRGDPLAGDLRVGVLPTIGPYVLPELSAGLTRALPRTRFVWVEEPTPVLVRRVSEGSLDAALLAREADLAGLETAEVARDPFVLAVPRRHPLARKGPVSRGELAGHEVLLLAAEHCFGVQSLEACRSRRAEAARFTATSLTTLARMAAGGFGPALLPALAAGSENRRHDLVVRRFASPVPARTLVLAWRSRSAIGEALRSVAAALREAWPAAG